MSLLRRVNRQLDVARRSVAGDLKAIRDRDPAPRTEAELFLYQGLHAIWMHRLAHRLFRARLWFLARLVSQVSRALTGIEIHPGARIGPGVFIDHGMGVVIGETAELGRDVTIYQGVTLGGTGKEGGKRHPTLGDRVVVGSGAQVLGDITIGDDAKIGAGSIVVKDVPPRSTVVGNPGRPVIVNGRKVDAVPPTSDARHQERLPDPIADVLRSLMDCIERLSHDMEAMRRGELEARDEGSDAHLLGADCLGRAEQQIRALTDEPPNFYGDGANI